MFVISADVGPRERREPRDLAEAAHAHLDDADLGVGLEPAERERHAELVVVVPLGRDRAPVGRAERGEDVLRRRLAGRAGDADDARPRAVAHLAARSSASAACGSLGHERRGGAAGERVRDEVGARRRRGDEEVALLDPPRVDLDARSPRSPRAGT